MRFEDLQVWQRARGLAKEVTLMGLGVRDDAGLGDQIRRAAISIVSNIAEGCERQSDAEFRRFLIIARGSCGEVRAQLYLALDCGHVSEERFVRLHREASEIGAMLSALITRVGARIKG